VRVTVWYEKILMKTPAADTVNEGTLENGKLGKC